MNSVLKDKIVSILTGIIIVTVVLVISYNTLMYSNTDMITGIFNMTVVGSILIAAFVYIAYHFNQDLLNFIKRGGSIFNFAEGFKESFKEGMGPVHNHNGRSTDTFFTQGGCSSSWGTTVGFGSQTAANNVSETNRKKQGQRFCNILYGPASVLTSTPTAHFGASSTQDWIHKKVGCWHGDAIKLNGHDGTDKKYNTSDSAVIANYGTRTAVGLKNVICDGTATKGPVHTKGPQHTSNGRSTDTFFTQGGCSSSWGTTVGFGSQTAANNVSETNRKKQGQRFCNILYGPASSLTSTPTAHFGASSTQDWIHKKVGCWHGDAIRLNGHDGTDKKYNTSDSAVIANYGTRTAVGLKNVICDGVVADTTPKIDQSWFNTQPSSTARSLSKGAIAWSGNTTENYMLQFDLFPQAKAGNVWTNIMHNTMTPSYKDCCSTGDRHPAIWFFANSTRLHIRTGHNSNGNHGWDPTDQLPLNKWSTIKIIVNDRYTGIMINLPTKTLYKVIKMDKRKSGNTKMYFSNPWNASANALVRNIKWQPNFKADPDFGQFDFAGNDIKQIPSAKNSPKECQDECKKESECTHFSFIKDNNCWLKRGTPVINTSENSKARSKVYPILSGLREGKTKWSCVSNISTPVRLDPDSGDVTCLSSNGRDCKWGQCDTELGTFPTGNEPLVCGSHHKTHHGTTGYDDPNHWCNKTKSALGWIPNTCKCDNGSAAKGPHDCDSINPKKCIACNPGYHLVGRECKPNTCICSNGTPASEGDPTCTTKNANICTSCNGGYTLKGKACTPNVCTCENGTPVAEGSASCIKTDENVCKSCKNGYHIDGVICVKDPWTQEKGKECVRKEFVNKDPQSCNWTNWSKMHDDCLLNEVGLADGHIIEDVKKNPPNCNWSSVSSSVKTPDNYNYMFDGCCRGDAATTWVMKGNMSVTECARKCDDEDDCNAIEVNGCLKDSENCSGKCYHFKGTKGGDIKFGGCVTTGDQKCYKKIQHYIQDVPDGDTPTDAVPPAHLMPTDPPCPEGCIAPRKSTGNCASVAKKGANWRECPFSCATPFGEGCNYDNDCTKAKCGAHYCSNVDGTPCPAAKDKLDNAEGILMDKATDEWNGSTSKFTSTSKTDSNKGYNAQGDPVQNTTIQSVSDPLDKIQQAEFSPIPQGYTIINRNIIQRVLINKTKEWKNISENQNINFIDMGKNFMLEVSSVRNLAMPQISANNYKIIGQAVASIVVEKNKGEPYFTPAIDKLVNIISNMLSNTSLTSNNTQNTTNQFVTTNRRTTNMMNENSNALINQLSINDTSNQLYTKGKYSSTYKPYDSLFSLS